MGGAELFIIALGLSMDAFAVALCKGIPNRKIQFSQILICGAWFGSFQALMPLIGFFLGNKFESKIDLAGHWVAFVLLVLIGLNMIKESFEKHKEKDCACSFSAKAMLPLAVATSIDALAVGVSLSFMHSVHIFYSILLIGVTTFVISSIGVRLGSIFGNKASNLKTELIGGGVLILMGIKILLEGLGVL